MSKRITLTDAEIEAIIACLTAIVDESKGEDVIQSRGAKSASFCGREQLRRIMRRLSE